MKTINNAAARCNGGVSLPLPKPGPTRSRPVRRGQFWPGENFTSQTHQWNLAGAFADHAFVLPSLASPRGPQTL